MKITYRSKIEVFLKTGSDASESTADHIHEHDNQKTVKTEDATMSWIFPCNKEYFDIDGAFKNMEYLNWDIQNHKVEVGDYVYIYVSAPESAIRYKCVVTDLSDTKTIDDSAYGGRPTGCRANQATLKFLYTYTGPGIELSDMRELGINSRFSMQSIIHMPEELEEYINRIEEESEMEEGLEGLHGEEREAVLKVRVNQGRFRNGLLRKYCHCCLCAVSSQTLLTASHIKPWTESEPEEKTDINNGLLLCPNHDRLFDKGFITFDNDGSIIISEELSENDRMFLNVSDSMTIEMNGRMASFMEYHREHVFRG